MDTEIGSPESKDNSYKNAQLPTVRRGTVAFKRGPQGGGEQRSECNRPAGCDASNEIGSESGGRVDRQYATGRQPPRAHERPGRGTRKHEHRQTAKGDITPRTLLRRLTWWERGWVELGQSLHCLAMSAGGRVRSRPVFHAIPFDFRLTWFRREP